MASLKICHIISHNTESKHFYVGKSIYKYISLLGMEVFSLKLNSCCSSVVKRSYPKWRSRDQLNIIIIDNIDAASDTGAFTGKIILDHCSLSVL